MNPPDPLLYAGPRHVGAPREIGLDAIQRFTIASPLGSSSAGGGGGSVTLPFKMNDTSPDATTPKINVVYGTIMDEMVGGVGFDDDLTPGETNTLYIDTQIDDLGIVTQCDLFVSTTGVPADSTYHAYLLVGTVLVDEDGLITNMSQSLYFSQGFSSCGRDPLDPATTRGTYQFFVR